MLIFSSFLNFKKKQEENFSLKTKIWKMSGFFAAFELNWERQISQNVNLRIATVSERSKTEPFAFILTPNPLAYVHKFDLAHKEQANITNKHEIRRRANLSVGVWWIRRPVMSRDTNKGACLTNRALTKQRVTATHEKLRACSHTFE